MDKYAHSSHGPPPDQFRGHDSRPSGHRKGSGKGMHSGDLGAYVPTTEYRIPVDVNAFPPDSNIIMLLLGPRGSHQQRMKMESDSIVTTSGKGVRGQHVYGEEPLSLVVRSKDPSIALTQRQISVVYQIYEDILKNVKETGNSDNAGHFVINTNHILPCTLMEFLWNIHLLLSRPRPQDLKVPELYDAYSQQFGHECPLASWLVVDPQAGGVKAALSRIPHIVELYQSPPSVWLMRAANPPTLNYTQLREVDDSYKMRLQQIAAGRIPLEDLTDVAGVVTGMLFGVDRVNACVNIIQGVIKILTDKKSMTFPSLKSEFLELYKVSLDVFSLIQERSLLCFLLKFKPVLFNVFNDGTGWKISLTPPVEDAPPLDVETVVKSIILVQPSQRRVVRLAACIPAGPLVIPDEPVKEDPKDSIAALVSILQGFKAAPEPPQPPASSVTAQINQLLQRKKQQTAEPVASGNALNELMAALQAAKKT